jgi:hypothetical protein
VPGGSSESVDGPCPLDDLVERADDLDAAPGSVSSPAAAPTLKLLRPRRVAQQDAHHVGAEHLAHALHEHVEQLVELEVRQRRLGDLLELPDRLDDRLGLGRAARSCSARRCSVTSTTCQM